MAPKATEARSEYKVQSAICFAQDGNTSLVGFEMRKVYKLALNQHSMAVKIMIWRR